MRIIAIFIVMLAAINNSAASAVGNSIEKLIKEVDPEINIGIKIVNLSQDKEVYSLNSGRYFTFASCLKAISVFSILDHYSTDYKFSSRITTDGNNLYLHVNDPDFATADLKLMIDKLKAKLKSEFKEKNIKNFYIVKDEFTLPKIIRERAYADGEYCYGANISKVHINKNCIKMHAAPTSDGKNIKISHKDIIPYKIKNTALTVGKGVPDRIYVKIDNNNLNISGTLSKSTGTVPISAVVNDGAEHLLHMVNTILSKQGITIKGKVLTAKKIGAGKTLVSHTKSFAQLAAKAIIKSDNFISDSLLAYYATRQKADEWSRAAYYLKKLVKTNFNVDLSNTTIHDASGLSRSNSMTVDHFSKFLMALSKKDNFQEMKQIFGTPGDKGKMQNRLQGQTGIYAKTGSLTGVTSLIGYYYNDKKELHSFVIVINNYYGNKKKYLNLIDDIVKTAKQL